MYFFVPGFKTIENKLTLLRDRLPFLFLKRYIYGKYSSKIKYVGFKLFYDQARHLDQINRRGFWNKLKKMPNIKIILLYRENFLASLVSLEIAQKTNKWAALKSEDNNYEIRFDYNDLKQQLESRKLWIEEMRKMTEGMKVFETTYEKLDKNSKESLSQILNYLELDDAELKSPLVKQQKHPLSEVVTNYEELKFQFSGTEWDKYFD